MSLKGFNRRVGCGMWLVGLLAALFAGEWLLLWSAVQIVPPDQLPLAMVIIAIATIAIGTIAIYFRVQRRMQ